MTATLAETPAASAEILPTAWPPRGRNQFSIGPYSGTLIDVTTILVPYHQDVLLPPAEIPVSATRIVRADPHGPDRWERIAAVQQAVASAVASSAGLPVVFSGDCLVAGGVVAGLQRAGHDPGVVWFDAHGDVHTLATSMSGYLGGLSLRLVTGAHPDRFAERFGLRPVPPERAVLVDARDLDPAEAEYLATGAIRRVAVPEAGADSVPRGSFVLHVDVDVIDDGEMPGLRFPVPGGPRADEVLAAAGRLLATGRVVAVHVACPWRPAATAEIQKIRTDLLHRIVTLAARPAGG